MKLCKLSMLVLFFVLGVCNFSSAQKVFSFYPPKEKPDMELSEALERCFDIYSFLPALNEKEIEASKERLIVHHSDKGIFAIRKGKWKLMFDNKGGSTRRTRN